MPVDHSARHGPVHNVEQDPHVEHHAMLCCSEFRPKSEFVSLSPRGALDWLNENGLLHADAASIAGVTITRHSSRNESYLVQLPSGDGYFFKSASSIRQSASIRHEAGVYEALIDMTGSTALIPDLVHFDQDRSLLVLRAIQDLGPLDPLALSTRRAIAGRAGQFGRALAHFHSLPVKGNLPVAPLPSAYSIILPPLYMRPMMSPANLELARLIQNDVLLSKHIVRASETWSPTTVMHGDLKWANCLRADSTGRHLDGQIKLVDLESSGRGDPTWDVGCVIAAYLRSWIISISSVLPAAEKRGGVRVPLSLGDLQLALQSFWRAYVRSYSPGANTSAASLDRAVHQAVCRLVWSVFEISTGRDRLSERALVTLQLAHNLVARPEEGLRNLLGLSA
jgi:Phosphotransferase enzyme family